MRLFSRLYDRTLIWAAHPHARWYLAGLSFAEASFFPIPPDVMLVPMTLARPRASWRLALLTTLASAFGGVAGYLIGLLAFEAVHPLIIEFGYEHAYLVASTWFAHWGFWAVFLAGFSPIPYKVFTITAGAVAMFFPAFLVASVVGRGARFFLVAGLVRWGGPKVADQLRRYIDVIGWLLVVALVVAYLIYRWR